MSLNQRSHALIAACAALALLAGCHLPTTFTDSRSKALEDRAALKAVENSAAGEASFLGQLQQEPDGWTRTVEDPGETRIHATSRGPVIVVCNDVHGDDTGRFLVAALTPDGAVRWSQELRSGIRFGNSERMRSAVSPNGRFLGLAADSTRQATQNPPVVAYALLDLETGTMVRTGTEVGLLLGMSLTNTEMAVQTSGTDFPAGLDWSENPQAPTGPSTLTRLPLADGQAAAQVQHTDLWLAGADSESLFLSDTPLWDQNRGVFWHGLATVSLMDASGTITGTVTGVQMVSPDGVLHRCEPQAGGDAEDNPACELYEPRTGARTPTNAQHALCHAGPTENLILLQQKVPETSPKRKQAEYVLVSWTVGTTTPRTDARVQCWGYTEVSCQTLSISQS